MLHIGRVHEVMRYPVKSMAGIAVESAIVGWHGLAGDRRFAHRRVGVDSGFPWLSASRLPELLLYQPLGLDEQSGEPLPTHVRTPDGAQFALGSAELDRLVSERLGQPVEWMRLKHGIFDEAAVSVIGLATIAAIGRQVGQALDRRRFRANIVIDTEGSQPFQEDEWVGGALIFGQGDAGAVVRVTLRDVRCAMINLDPATAEKDGRVMKAVVQLNDNNAGVYATVVRSGPVRAGDPVRFLAEPSAPG